MTSCSCPDKSSVMCGCRKRLWNEARLALAAWPEIGSDGEAEMEATSPSCPLSSFSVPSRFPSQHCSLEASQFIRFGKNYRQMCWCWGILESPNSETRHNSDRKMCSVLETEPRPVCPVQSCIGGALIGTVG